MNVQATLVTKTQSFPAGTIGGAMQFKLMQGASQRALQEVPMPIAGPVTFANVVAGTYNLIVTRLNDAGVTIGSSISQSVVVAAPPPVDVEVPDTMTVTVS